MIVNYNELILQNSDIGEVIIWDETLRDGEQAPGVAFTSEQKIKIARLLDEMGVRIIDIGFPAVSEEERETTKMINELGLEAELGVTIRAKEEDIDSAVECGFKKGFIFAPTSEVQVSFKFGTNCHDFKQRVIRALNHALERGMDVYFISEDTSRSGMDFIIPYFNEIYEMGIDKIMITDTVGIMLPFTMRKFVTYIREHCHPDIKFGVHCHSDFGLSTANTLAAVEAGVVFPTVTVNGIGERAGNASFEETVMALESLYKVNTGIDLKKIKDISRMVEQYSGLPVAPNKAVVGFNAFRHESGIHVDAMLKSPRTYESISPEILGKSHQFVLGKHSGRNLIRNILRKRGIDDEKLVEYLTDKVKKMVYNKEKKEEMYYWLQNYYIQVLGITEEDLVGMLPHYAKN